MTEAQIKHMVERFLSWRLPDDFSPDAGISFKAGFNENTAHQMRHEPTGTNLFDATQAEAMVRHMIAGLEVGEAGTRGEAHRLRVALGLLAANLRGEGIDGLKPISVQLANSLANFADSARFGEPDERLDQACAQHPDA